MSTIQAIFTDKCWNKLNEDQVYVEWNGKVCFFESINGGGYYYNKSFPDEFRLIEKAATHISFLLIGHYSPVYPKNGESFEERDARREREYDYTLEFPMEMVLTDSGWRFSEFHSALKDEREVK